MKIIKAKNASLTFRGVGRIYGIAAKNYLPAKATDVTPRPSSFLWPSNFYLPLFLRRGKSDDYCDTPARECCYSDTLGQRRRKKKTGAGTALHLFFLTALFFLGSNFVILDTFFARTCSKYSFLYSSMHAVFLALFTLEASLRIE